CLHNSTNLTSRHRANDQERFLTFGDRVGQLSLRRFVGPILFAGKKSHERAALQRAVLANRPAQRWITRLQRVEHGAQRHRSFNFKLHLAVHARQVAQMKWKYDANHDSSGTGVPPVCFGFSSNGQDARATNKSQFIATFALPPTAPPAGRARRDSTSRRRRPKHKPARRSSRNTLRTVRASPQPSRRVKRSRNNRAVAGLS